MTQQKIVSEMFYTLWDTPKDKFTWHSILHDTLKKLETNESSKMHKMLDTNKRCKHIKREGESCRLNNNCTYPDCEIVTFKTKER